MTWVGNHLDELQAANVVSFGIEFDFDGRKSLLNYSGRNVFSPMVVNVGERSLESHINLLEARLCHYITGEVVAV